MTKQAKEDAIIAAVGRRPCSLCNTAREKGDSTMGVLLQVAHYYARRARLFPDDCLVRIRVCRRLQQHAAGELIHTTQYKHTKGIFTFQHSQ